MTGFWIIAALLLAAALAFVLPPLLRPGKAKAAPRRDDINVTIYRDQLAELESDLNNGTISQEQYDQARVDLEKSLLADVAAREEGAAEQTATTFRAGRVSAIVVGIAIPVLAISLYGKIGGGEAALDPEKAQPQVVTKEHLETIEGMVQTLAERLKTEPDNIDGWFMLGRSYQFLRRYDEAKAAFEKVMDLGGGNNPDFLATYADVLAMMNDRRIGDESVDLIKKALQLNPFHVKSLWLAGTAAYQNEDYNSALKYWERLAGVLPPGSEDERSIRANIDEVRSMAGLSPAAAPVPQAPTAKAGGAELSGSVKLDGTIAAKANPSDTVFIFARAANGPRMPLAILRRQVKDLPLDFSLDDSMAMNPAMKLSDFPQVVVGARISKSGNAMPQPGDLEGYSDVIQVGAAQQTRINIDRVVQ